MRPGRKRKDEVYLIGSAIFPDPFGSRSCSKPKTDI
jgi:hypothetical protein